MTPREIVARAWAITKQERGIRRWGYVSAFLETLLNIKLLIYQTWFLITYLQGDPIGFFTIEAVLFEHLPRWGFWTFVISLIVLLIVEFLFPHLAKGAIIGLAAKSYRKEEMKVGLVLAIYNFFPIFAVHEMFFLSRIPMTITIISIILRYGGPAAPIGIALVIGLFCLSNLLKFFFIFGEEAVVLRKKGVRIALKSSFKTVISYLGHIIFLMLLFFVIMLRIVINILMIFLIPGVVIGVGFVLTLFLPHVIGYSIGALLGLIGVFFASYLFAYMEVFGQTVWTLTYMELSARKDLDVIMDDAEESAPAGATAA